jgi:uncharacterized protein YndB with AHSA1/START domain
MTASQPATRYLAAPPEEVQAILSDPAALPPWNEAFLSVSGPPRASTGVRYSLAVRPGLRGYWEYTTIAPDRIEAVWTVPGFHEHAVWTLRPEGEGTTVTHTFQHSGALAAVLSRAYRGVAALRLERLGQRVLLANSRSTPASGLPLVPP